MCNSEFLPFLFNGGLATVQPILLIAVSLSEWKPENIFAEFHIDVRKIKRNWRRATAKQLFMLQYSPLET